MPKYDWSNPNQRYIEEIAYSRSLEEARRSFGFPATLPEDATLSAALAETFAANSPPGVNVNGFAAAGVAINDGVGDATQAFASAMAVLSARGGGVLYMPAGTYLGDFPALVANVTVRGDGIGRTILKAKTVNSQWLGTDVSNITLEAFTFQGKSNSGASTTNNAVWIRAVAADVSNIAIRDCEFKDFKTDGAIRFGGNGDLLSAATVFVRSVRVERNKISQYYDIDPLNIGQISAGIYAFGGFTDLWIVDNDVDGTSGKQGILVQSEGTGATIEGNRVKNCGLTNNSDGSYGISAYSGYVSAFLSDISILRNNIRYTARAGIYLAAIRNYGVDNNILFQPDQGSTGLGTVGAGGIHINDSADDARNGSGSVNGNKIYDPGFAAINLSLGTFQRTEMSCVGNVCKMLTAGLSRFGVVINGRGAIIGKNTIRGFTRGVYIYNTVADDCGDITISENGIDGTGAAATIFGITVNSTTFRIGHLEINNNRIKGCPNGVDVRPASVVGFTGNKFAGATTSAIIQGIEFGVVSHNVSDGGTTGLNIALKAATATARATVSGNVMGSNTTPCVVTENTGQINVSGNDFGTQPGRAADQGDANIASVTNNPTFEVFPFSTTLTANRSATLNAAKCFKGDKKTIVRDAGVPGAFTLALVNDLGATLATIPANTKGFATAVFDGTNWKLHSSGTYA